MLASNRNVDRLMKAVPNNIRNAFIELNQAAATDDDVRKMFVIFERALADYRRTLEVDSRFYGECANNPIPDSAPLEYTYAHLLNALRLRMEAASTLEERELLRRSHYGQLEEYKYANARDLEPVIDSLVMELATPSWWDNVLKFVQRQPKSPKLKKLPMTTPNPKKVEAEA